MDKKSSVPTQLPNPLALDVDTSKSEKDVALTVEPAIIQTFAHPSTKVPVWISSKLFQQFDLSNPSDSIHPTSLSNTSQLALDESLGVLQSYPCCLVVGKGIPTAIVDSVVASLNLSVEDCFIIDDQENAKSLTTVQTLWDFWIQRGYGKSVQIIALGGGTVTDVVGFASSTYLRGVACWMVPTTLLAAVDAAIGGKNGVNHAQGKNLIGHITQPKGVMVDTHFFKTLTPQQFAQGLAEVVKVAFILDVQFFEYLEANQDFLKSAENLDHVVFLKMITQSIALKSKIVTQDEKESKLRKSLNFGHTLGHALEAASSYRLSHGEAVALGMVFATRISVSLQLCTAQSLQRLINLLHAFALPTQLPTFFDGLKDEDILSYLKVDKKKVYNAQLKQQELQWVLVKGLGDFEFRVVPDAVLLEQIEALR